MSEHLRLVTLVSLLALCVSATTSLKAHRGLAHQNTQKLIAAISGFSTNLRYKKYYDKNARDILKMLSKNATAANLLAEEYHLTKLLYDAEGLEHDPVKPLKEDWEHTLLKFKGVNGFVGFGCYGQRQKHTKWFDYLCVFDKIQ